MKILVIVGECIQINSSANLCHLAYLRGLVEAGNDVTLLSADKSNYVLDEEMRIPEGVKTYTFDGVTLYEKLAGYKRRKKKTVNKISPAAADNAVKGRSKKNKLKSFALSFYGPHGIYSKFVSTASHFHADEPFDVLISLSTPPASHLLAYKLLSSKHVKSSHWIQIWEDPWSNDVFCIEKKKEAFREERRLLKLADRVCYVSPITLAYQKESFPESAHKMFWVPLPSYYSENRTGVMPTDKKCFGYFGDYRKIARNLEPFYNAAKEAGAEVNICGFSDLRLESTGRIHVYPRLPLSELKPIEDQTDVLVFLSNSTGGQIPGKIYQYASTSKTILFILDGSDYEKRILKNFFAPFNRFVFCENNKEDIKNAINAICSGKLGDIQNQPLTQFEPPKIIQQILHEGMK